MMAHVAELTVPVNAPVERFNFEQQGNEGWKRVDGLWTVEEISGTPSGKWVLIQGAVKNVFKVIIAPGGPYSNVDLAVQFKPISGREGASGGIVLRSSEGHDYVVRANALEHNFRLYYYDSWSRHPLASARAQSSALGQWHTIQVVVVGDHIQASRNGECWLDHPEPRSHAGQVGLWITADSAWPTGGVCVSQAVVRTIGTRRDRYCQ